VAAEAEASFKHSNYSHNDKMRITAQHCQSIHHMKRKR
jgi:hypothetical protein